jgi:hypothetical protein
VQALPSSVHGVLNATKVSAGHVAPLHVSATSHGPVDARHTVPADAAAWAQAPALHVSTVHGLPSSQLTHAIPAAPQAVGLSVASAVHVPLPSVPQPVVQQLPSSQRPPAQLVPFVQFVPGVHAPAPLQTSPDVQMLPSSQAVVTNV